MALLTSLKFNNTFHKLGGSFYAEVRPRVLANPYIVSANPEVADLIGLDETQLKSPEFLSLMAGEKVPLGCQPLAMVYSGHQFGHYNPRLGDGRGILLGQVDGSQAKWDLHLKGAGLTPFSRQGDGRAVLRSSIREYLCSEAMYGLGIPTTRGLAIAGSDSPVYRETLEHGATLLRVAESHVRFGSFEYFYYTQQYDCVEQLAEYVIANNFPHLLQQPKPFAALLSEVVAATAKLIAQWQSVGFNHGVMNTDNMSILGHTFDYGPFAFLDDYEYGYICNHSDAEGRYAFSQQPYIGLWNCHALAQTFGKLVAEEELRDILATYEPILLEHYWRLMRDKSGSIQAEETDQAFIGGLLGVMENNKVDYTIFFRRLCDYKIDQKNTAIRDLFLDRSAADSWLAEYNLRLQREASVDDDRAKRMRQCNPKYILRNYMLQNAITAAQNKNFSEVDLLLKLISNPFAEQPEYEDYAKHPPTWGKGLEISCSS